MNRPPRTSELTGRRVLIRPAALLSICFLGIAIRSPAADIAPVVEVEEDVYTYKDAANGAGPMWCAGSTTLVRSGDGLFASGLETIPDAKPLNNCRWVLYARGKDGWKRVRADEHGRTREPSPMAAFPDGRVFLSVNPTLGGGAEPNGGSARPDVLQFRAEDPTAAPASLSPIWKGSPPFAEHSYRSFVADGRAGELLLFQNIGYRHAEWTFRDRAGNWSAQGRITWPTVGDSAKPTPLRLCYPNVALRDRAAFFLGVGDVLEPNPAFRSFKRELTGRDWDYVFCRLFYAWTPDVTTRPFGEWIEIANRDATRGHVWPCDLWVAPDGDVHILWTERAIDGRLRAKFFPEAKQSETLNHAVIRAGKVVGRTAIVHEDGQDSGVSGLRHRFQITPDNRLFVVHGIAAHREGAGRVLENRLVEILPDGRLGEPTRIPLKHPFADFFTATVRAGSPPSWTLDMLGTCPDAANTIRYARIQIVRPDAQPPRTSSR